MVDNYGIKSGYVTEADLDADTDAFFVNWQGLVTAGDVTANSMRWSVQTDDMVENGMQRVKTTNGRARELGDLQLSDWILTLSTDMAIYLESTIFNGSPDALVTIKTRDRYTGDWIAVQCICERSRLTAEVSPVNTQYMTTFRLSFSECEIAPAS